MTLSADELKKISDLAYLSLDTNQEKKLVKDIANIMNFINQLQSVDTENIPPLSHPLDVHQRLRKDEVTESECIQKLAAIAPLFEDNLYLVPKIIDSGN